ncbi:GIY-YIG nuclease family protein [Gilvimarinus algae]|uniref:GIY-YIG nuclease family protein n=1 Tax=Gilvimarinus algae TaxID=3058037 RepID=A0ABT8TIW9_9GAMM|nr:GIY-YIG nuclease family protein [Gilvimarinus sp. SDUM040014]MDO3382272.1 GIY-YIG nuclease family protein [Gilvimarinus sp. SDUM040014]
MWFTYIIECDNGRLYTGITTDINRRWQEHCSGTRGARFFRTCRPERLVWLETFSDRAQASQREAGIKKMTRAQKLALLQQPCSLPLPALVPIHEQ